MLPVIVIKYLQEAWSKIDMTVNKAISLLDSLIIILETFQTEESYNLIPEPSNIIKELIATVFVQMPSFYPQVKVNLGNRM